MKSWQPLIPQFFLLFLFYYLLEIQIIHIFGHLKLSHSSPIVCLFMFSLLSLCISLLLDFKFTNIAVFCFLQLLVHCLFHSALLRSCKFISKNVLLLAFNIFIFINMLNLLSTLLSIRCLIIINIWMSLLTNSIMLFLGMILLNLIIKVYISLLCEYLAHFD